MSEEKCFCHLNGYKVKDADARADIENINARMGTIEESLKNLPQTGMGGTRLYKHKFTWEEFEDPENPDVSYMVYQEVVFITPRATKYPYDYIGGINALCKESISAYYLDDESDKPADHFGIVYYTFYDESDFEDVEPKICLIFRYATDENSLTRKIVVDLNHIAIYTVEEI